MIELKKVGFDEMYWSFGSKFSVEHAYNALKEVVPEEDFIFAQYRLGPNYHSWLVDGDRWLPMSEANDIEQGIIMGIYADKVASIQSKIGACEQFSKLDCSKFTMVPFFEDHLFFRRDESSVSNYKIALVAWGYEVPPVRNNAHKIQGRLFVDSRVGVSVAFVRGGKKLPSEPFAIENPYGPSIDFTTNEDGIFSLGLILPGKLYDIRHVATGRIFRLTVENITKLYEFDVSQMADLEVALMCDEKPVANENVYVSYDEQIYKATTNVNGEAVISLSVVEGEECCVNAMGESRNVCITPPNTRVVISTKTIVEETHYTPIIKVVWDDGTPCSGRNIYVAYDKTYESYVSDDDGRVQLPAMIPNEFMKVVDRENPDVNEMYKLDVNQSEYIFVIERDAITTVKVCDKHQRSITRGQIVLTQGEKRECFSRAGTGEFSFNSKLFSDNMPIGVELQVEGRSFELCSFTYTSQETQYELVVRDRSMSWWNILLICLFIILLILGLQLALDFVLVQLGYEPLLFFNNKISL